MNEEQKKEIYRKWAESGYKQPATKEGLDIIVELQSKGYKANTYVVKEQGPNAYKVTQLQEPKIKREKSTAELIAEAKKLLQKQEPIKRKKN
jgi:hypothetical protein